MNEERELEILAALVHAILAVLHLLGFAYNVRRRNRFDATVHAAAFVYDARSTYVHVKDAGR